jgi:hypothetical protein
MYIVNDFNERSLSPDTVHGKTDMKNTGLPSMIFKRDKDGRLYQDILKYSINGKYKEDDGKSFRLWYLTKWLLEVNQDFINYFNSPRKRNYTIANRIEDRTSRILGKVEDLAKLGLIAQTGTAKQTKGTGIVSIFQFTHVGHAIAWILESTGDKREFAINKLYELFQDNFKDDSSCNDMFNSIYYRKIKDLGLFGHFIDRYREQLESDVMNRQGFFQQLLILPGYNIERSDIDFYKLWKDSIMELHLDTRMHFYHHVKLDLERKAEEECRAFRNFEELRFIMKHNPQSVVVEGHCKTCGYVSAAHTFDEYMELAIRNFHNGVIKLTCLYCKKNDWEFPILI